MIYLASPFSSPDRQIEFERYRAALNYTHQQLAWGRIIFSPIVYCYPIAVNHGLPGDFKFWREFNFAVIERCDELRILRLDGWRESVGVQAEAEFAKSKNIPVHMVLPV